MSEASTKEYQEYLPDEVLEAGIKVVRERDFLMEELLLIMMINFYQMLQCNWPCYWPTIP